MWISDAHNASHLEIKIKTVSEDLQPISFFDEFASAKKVVYTHVCLFVCLFVCWFVGLFVCLFVCLLVSRMTKLVGGIRKGPKKNLSHFGAYLVKGSDVGICNFLYILRYYFNKYLRS